MPEKLNRAKRTNSSELNREKINPDLDFIYKPLPSDDPMQRKPLIDRAKKELSWEPKVLLNKGVDETIEWFRQTIE